MSRSTCQPVNHAPSLESTGRLTASLNNLDDALQHHQQRLNELGSILGPVIVPREEISLPEADEPKPYIAESEVVYKIGQVQCQLVLLSDMVAALVDGLSI